MHPADLDAKDRQILNLLQENARYPATKIADELGVSDNTVHSRIDRLEERGIITGYTANIDYEALGIDLMFQFTCTTGISERAAIAEEALSLPDVTGVTELMTGERNLNIKGIGVGDADMTRLAAAIDDLNLTLNAESLRKRDRTAGVDFMSDDIPWLVEQGEA